MGHTKSWVSEVLDIGLEMGSWTKCFAARAPPTYDHPTGPTGTRVAKDTSSAENDPKQLHQILVQCHETLLDCLIRGG